MSMAVNRRFFIKAVGATVGVGAAVGAQSAQAATTKKVVRKHIKGVNMALTQDEINTLNGKKGATMAKVMRSVVAYGDAFEAPYLVDITHDGHWVTGMGQNGLDALFDLSDTLIAGGCKANRPFTIDPYPMDYENIDYTQAEIEENKHLYCFQERWDKQVQKLGLRKGGRKNYSCTCYLPQVGNTPQYGENLAWAESSAVVFANSVLGARCNRNSGPMEMLCSIAGKTPYFGFLTDAERKAVWVIDVQTSKLPNAMLLGSAIGMKVGQDVPYITGMDKMLGNNMDDVTIDYLKDFGAATASNGAVGLFHMDGITPEAKKLGRKLIASGAKHFTVTDEVLAETKRKYPILWSNPNATPRYAIVGCPHLTLNQLNSWDLMIDTALRAAGKKRLAITTILCASPMVIDHLTPAQVKRLKDNGVRISGICGAMYMINKVSRSYPCITNSNKLRTYSTARFYEDEELLEYVVSGKAPVNKA